ncbi:MAG: asparagine synthase B [Caldilineaceae bacterium]
MCGIAGILGDANQTEVETMLESMIAKIKHRGPDGKGGHYDPGAHYAFGHCRLAIMDPQGGAQPLFSEDNSIVMVDNGEIYNFPALRANLQARHEFRTYSDSEAIVHLFEEQGAAAFAQLDGMFALALHAKDAFWLARDPIGIKPLYYGYKQGQQANTTGAKSTIYFGSELKSLVDVADEVHEFPPGVYFDSRYGFTRYYEVPDRTPEPLAVADVARRVRTTLEAAVTKRLMSDVPVGAFLSGGLDSSLIAAIARQHVDQLHTFSVGIEGSPDIQAARVVAKHIDSIHHEYLYTVDDVRQHLPEIIYHLESFDQDLVRSAIPCYFCSRLAAKHVKVILTGEGADELFAGYRYYKEYRDAANLHRELRRSVTALHNINLQRVDRLTMCHGIEGRVPFLDTAMIDLAQSIEPALKLKRAPNGRQVEKWILRKACEDLLPAAIVWRDKAQFDEGSGTVDLLGPLLETMTAGMDAPSYMAAHAQDKLRSTEECFYHKLLAESFRHSRVVLDNVGRWSGEHRASV